MYLGGHNNERMFRYKGVDDMNKENIKRIHGFTLIELLIVMGMLGVVMTAVYSLYAVQSRTAIAQDELVEVQQNLRIAMDEISRDIKMSGFLLPVDPACSTVAVPQPLTPVRLNSVFNNAGLVASDAMTLNIASAAGQYARINQKITSGASTVFVVDSAESVDRFVNVNFVRIVRVQTLVEPSPGLMAVTGTNRAALTITVTTNPGVTYMQSDVIIGTSSGVRPDTIQYCVASSTQAGVCPAPIASCPANQNCIVKVVNGTANLLATNIKDLQFAYLLKDNTEVNSPPDLRQVRAIRVTISGETVATNTATREVRKRQMMSVVKMRNETQECI